MLARLLYFVVGGALLAGSVGVYVLDPSMLLGSLFLSVFSFMILGGAFVSGPGEARGGKYSLARPERNVTFSSLEEPGTVLNAWVLAVLVSATFGVGAYEVFTHPRHAGAPAWVRPVMVALVLAGVWMLVKATLRTLDRASFERVQLRLPAIPVTGTLRGRIDLAKRDASLQQLRATLVCDETFWEDIPDVGPGTRKTTHELWSAQGTFPVVQKGGGGTAEIAFEIPAGLPGTSHPATFGLSGAIQQGRRYHEWRLRLDSPSRTFILPVRASAREPARA